MGNWDLRLSLSLQSLSESFSIMLLKRSTLSCLRYVQLFATLWNVAHKTPQSMRFSRQEYWSGSSCPPPGDLSNLGIEPSSLRSPTLTGSLSLVLPEKHLLRSWMRLKKKTKKQNTFRRALEWIWGEGKGNPLQCSSLENSMDRGIWRATVHGITESQTWLSN